MMEIRDLWIFKELAENGNTTKTAEKLNYVQSNITGRIKKLESELQTQLFYRHARGVSLTSKGTLLLSYTDQILHLIDTTKKAVQDSEIIRGPLYLGANETTASARLPALLASYNQRYPEVDLSLKIGETHPLINDVLNYKLDGAFVVGPVQDDDLIQTPVMEEELVLITDQRHSLLSWTDLKYRTLLTRPSCIYRKRLEQWLQEEGIFPRKIMEFGTLESIIGCVKAGLGVSITTQSLVKQYQVERDLNLHSLPPKYSNVSTVFIRREDTFVDRAYKNFLSMVKQQDPAKIE
ncbi:DNA-binding transcriptional LysR family regulator [Geomicrobium halophilum]|uniref:DNA-binding transcriptional LysR family regulator n=1 Tax=Geomicrobium halophilum TaxID=549000 RepID=A0A841PLL4_9BACL|nr:LysR substrate-binding domain-containing protein [Geomicrobium halophilum]MBB6449747.1 DNA-binding transcriptional LysR family regulator [Geomicrobium halophilum]